MSRNERGVAIIIALLTILILSTLGAAIMFSTQAEITTTYNYKRLTQARYAAEAGAQNTVNWLIYNYTVPSSFGSFDTTKSPVQYMSSPVVLSAMNGVAPNYPDSAVQVAFNSALLDQPVSGMDVGVSYATTATLQSMRVVTPFGGSGLVPLQSWLIKSQATLAGSTAQVEVTTTIEKFGSPVFSYAIFGTSTTCGAVSFAGNSSTDSFDSTQGTYSATHQNTLGNIGTNGNIDLAGAMTIIHGSGSSPFSTVGTCAASLTGLSTSGGATLGAGLVTLSSSVSYTAPAAPTPTSLTTTQTTAGSCGTIVGCTTLAGPNNIAFAPGQYGDVHINGGSVHLSQGLYSINSLAVAGMSTIIVDSGPVVLNFVGTGITGPTKVVDFAGGSVSNPTGKANNFQILYAGSQPVALSGGTNSYVVAYAPNAPVTLSGGADWFGAIVGNTVAISGGTAVHYDRSLASNLAIVGNYHATSFGWSKY